MPGKPLSNEKQLPYFVSFNRNRIVEAFPNLSLDMLKGYLELKIEEVPDAVYLCAAQYEVIANYLSEYKLNCRTSKIEVLDFAIHECNFLPAVLQKTELLLSDKLDDNHLTEHLAYLKDYAFFHLGPGIFAYAQLCQKQGDSYKALKLCLVANQLGGVTGTTLPVMITSLAAEFEPEHLRDINASAANLAVQVLNAYRIETFQSDTENCFAALTA